MIADAKREYYKLKEVLEAEHDLEDHDKADMLFEIAWDIGSIGSPALVKAYYARMSELIK